MRRLLSAAVVLLFLWVVLGGAASANGPEAAGGVVMGPYVQNVTQTEATICWGTLDGQASAFGPEGSEITARAYRHHEVRLRNLKADTEYRYNIPPGEPDSSGTFRTAPDASTPFSFVVLGDTRSRHEVHRRIVQGVMGQNPAFVLNTGDLVSSGRRMEDWEAFFDITSDLIRSIPYYPVLGNHEGDSTYYFDFFSLPGDERNYSFDWGAAHFICLDPEGPEIGSPQAFPYGEMLRIGGTHEEYLQKMMAFLRADLEEHAQTPLIFVAFHYPPYTAKSSRVEGAEQVRELFGPIFAVHRVTAVLNGHDHYYMRAQADGVTYVITGGGGAPLYVPDAPPPEAVKVAKIEHFVRVDIRPPGENLPGVATFTTYDIEGNVIDSWETLAR